MRNFITWVKGVLQMFFQRETIKRAVGAEVAISAGMQDATRSGKADRRGWASDSAIQAV